MILPADTGNWTERHLARVEDAKADDHYREYQRLVEQAEGIRNVLGLSKRMYP